MIRALRRLLLVPGLFALAISACSQKSEDTAVAQTSGELAVLEWAGYDAADFWIDF